MARMPVSLQSGPSTSIEQDELTDHFYRRPAWSCSIYTLDRVGEFPGRAPRDLLYKCGESFVDARGLHASVNRPKRARLNQVVGFAFGGWWPKRKSLRVRTSPQAVAGAL